MIRSVCTTTTAATNDVGKEAVYTALPLNDVQVNYALVDSGSAITLVTKTMRDAGRASDAQLLPLPSGTFATANKSQLNVQGKDYMRIRVARVDAVHPVIVVGDLTKHFILGNGFLRRHTVDISYSRNQLVSSAGVAP